jgi:hypothetical protein|tara:strand:- start:16062 stop:17183 length:1122 start_codon:yes stop_codon:yes gene_type:complete
MAKKPIRKKTRKVPVSRRSGITAAPTDSWRWFSDYFRMELDRKDVATIIRNYIRTSHPKEAKFLLSAPEYMYTMHHGVAASIAWSDRNGEFHPLWNHDSCVANFIAKLRIAAQEKSEEAALKVVSSIPVRTIADRIKEITSDFIAGIEEVVDHWNPDTEHRLEYNLYDEMKIKDISNVSAKAVLNYYQPLRDELKELVELKTPELVEGYSHLTVPQQKKQLAFIEGLVADAERYMMGKKAMRKSVKPRVKTADRQVAKLKYLKESKEFKLTSINPMSIVGSRRLYAFNTRYKVLMEIITQSGKGFEVSGSTIKNLDIVNSRQTTLRKPSEMLSIFQSKTIKQIDKYWSTLTTKTTQPTGRINKDVILLRVMDT